MNVCFINTVVMASGTSQGYFAFENNNLFVFMCKESVSPKSRRQYSKYGKIYHGCIFVILSNSIFSAVVSRSPTDELWPINTKNSRSTNDPLSPRWIVYSVYMVHNESIIICGRAAGNN